MEEHRKVLDLRGRKTCVVVVLVRVGERLQMKSYCQQINTIVFEPNIGIPNACIVQYCHILGCFFFKEVRSFNLQTIGSRGLVENSSCTFHDIR